MNVSITSILCENLTCGRGLWGEIAHRPSSYGFMCCRVNPLYSVEEDGMERGAFHGHLPQGGQSFYSTGWPSSLAPFYIVSYYMKWVKTSLIYSNSEHTLLINGNNIPYFIFHIYNIAFYQCFANLNLLDH